MSKYYYCEKKFRVYCKENELNYKSGVNLILYHYRKNPSRDINDVINEIVEKLFKRRELQKIKNVFKEVENSKDFSLLKATKVLNISYKNVYNIYRMGYKKKDALYIVWNLGDKILKNGKKAISKKKFQEFKILTYWNTSESNDFMTLLTLLKMEKISADLLIKKREKYLYKLSYRMFKHYDQLKRIKDITPADIYQILSMKDSSLFTSLVMDNYYQNIKCLNVHAKYTAISFLNSVGDNNIVVNLDDNIDDNRNFYDVLSNTYRGGYYG